MINVIIAEDDFRVASIHEQFLQQIEDVTVLGKAANAKETLNLLEEHENIDLVLLDIYLPDQLGTDILSIIREKHPDVDIIIITAATEVKHFEDSLRNGVFYYLIKPVTLEKFKYVINKYIKKRQLINDRKELTQEIVDQYFSDSIQVKQNVYPKSIDAITLKKVREILNEINTGITAEEMGERLGASRTTARRYLEYLTSINEAVVELEYGLVGRPERKYKKIK